MIDDEKIFDGLVIMNKKKYLKIQIPKLQRSFYLDKKSKIKISLGQKVNCRLYFYLFGIRSEVLALLE